MANIRFLRTSAARPRLITSAAWLCLAVAGLPAFGFAKPSNGSSRVKGEGEGGIHATVVRQENITGYSATGYDNIWYPNLQSPPEGSTVTGRTSDPDDSERLGTTTESLVDERPLWRMLTRKQYAQARGWIEKFRQRHPGWQPSEELKRVLRQSELQRALELHNQGQYKKAERLFSDLLSEERHR